MKALISFDSCKPYGRLLETLKAGGSRELFLPDNDFKTFSAVNFPKWHSNLRSCQPENQSKA